MPSFQLEFALPLTTLLSLSSPGLAPSARSPPIPWRRHPCPLNPQLRKDRPPHCRAHLVVGHSALFGLAVVVWPFCFFLILGARSAPSSRFITRIVGVCRVSPRSYAGDCCSCFCRYCLRWPIWRMPYLLPDFSWAVLGVLFGQGSTRILRETVIFSFLQDVHAGLGDSCRNHTGERQFFLFGTCSNGGNWTKQEESTGFS